MGAVLLDRHAPHVLVPIMSTIRRLQEGSKRLCLGGLSSLCPIDPNRRSLRNGTCGPSLTETAADVPVGGTHIVQAARPTEPSGNGTYRAWQVPYRAPPNPEPERHLPPTWRRSARSPAAGRAAYQMRIVNRTHPSPRSGTV
jgi:hypothetical protein